MVKYKFRELVRSKNRGTFIENNRRILFYHYSSMNLITLISIYITSIQINMELQQQCKVM